MNFVAKIDPNWENDDGLVMCTTIDGIHYPITEPRPFNKTYKSHKLGSAAVDYEYAIYTHKDKVAWISPPYPAGFGDKNIFCSGLLGMIRAKQEARGNDFRVIADDGYNAGDLLDALCLRNELDPREIAYFKDRALSRHETFNGMTKRYNCLCAKFRHDKGSNPNKEHPRHQACVEAICVTIQYELDLGVAKLLDPYPE